MALTKTGEEVLRSYREQYGSEKGEEYFYASVNKGVPGSSEWVTKDDGPEGQLSGGRSGGLQENIGHVVSNLGAGKNYVGWTPKDSRVRGLSGVDAIINFNKRR